MAKELICFMEPPTVNKMVLCLHEVRVVKPDSELSLHQDIYPGEHEPVQFKVAAS